MVRRFLGAPRAPPVLVPPSLGDVQAMPLYRAMGEKFFFFFSKGRISKGFPQVGGHEDFKVTFRMEWDSWWEGGDGEFFTVGFYKQLG